MSSSVRDWKYRMDAYSWFIRLAVDDNCAALKWQGSFDEVAHTCWLTICLFLSERNWRQAANEAIQKFLFTFLETGWYPLAIILTTDADKMMKNKPKTVCIFHAFAFAFAVRFSQFTFIFFFSQLVSIKRTSFSVAPVRVIRMDNFITKDETRRERNYRASCLFPARTLLHTPDT